jgi:hypothetical protein
MRIERGIAILPFLLTCTHILMSNMNKAAEYIPNPIVSMRDSTAIRERGAMILCMCMYMYKLHIGGKHTCTDVGALADRRIYRLCDATF